MTAGLETWTLRTVVMEELEGIPPPCLVGMQPLVGLKQALSVDGEALFLYAKMTEELTSLGSRNMLTRTEVCPF